MTSPFTPGQPVQIELFTGRQVEIERVLGKVRQSSNGRLTCGFLTGERGIGKSSLASFIRVLAERDYGLLGLHTFLGGVSSLEVMVTKIFDILLKESLETPWHTKIFDLFKDNIKEVGLFGVSVGFKASKGEAAQLVQGFIPALRKIVKSLSDEKKGLLLILDDINGLASSSDFANWIKSTIDEIAASQKPIPLCLILVGIEERRISLIDLQQSLDRILDPIVIHPWNEDETKEFYSKSFKQVGIEIRDAALDLLSRYTGGLPTMAHEIGDAAFNIDTDNIIDFHDARKAVYGAAEIIGRKHLQPKVYNAIRSDAYKGILKKISMKGSLGFHFSRKNVMDYLNENEKKVFDNFLKKMKTLGVITGDPDGSRGDYVFTNQLHHVYFWLETVKEERQH